DEVAIVAAHESCASAQQVAHLGAKLAVGVPALGHTIFTEDRCGDFPVRSSGRLSVKRLQRAHMEQGETARALSAGAVSSRFRREKRSEVILDCLASRASSNSGTDHVWKRGTVGDVIGHGQAQD